MAASPFTLRQLDIFASVVRHGQIHSAAQAIHLSDAAVSQALTELAGSLGVQLFERHGRRLVPTAHARQLAALTDEPLARLRAIPDQLVDPDDNAVLSGSVRIAASSTIARYILPEALAAVRRQYPHTLIELSLDNSANVGAWVADGDVDVGFIEGPNQSAGIVAQPWRTDHMHVIAPLDYPVDTIAVDRLNTHPWVGREAGSGSRAVFEQSLALAGYPPPSAHLICNDSGAIVRAVAGGAGLACVSQHATRQASALTAVQTVELADLALERPLWRISARSTGDHHPPVVARVLTCIDNWLDAIAS
ncbi:LysR family transcriptional regulator [Salinisphaera sp. USBA-960]|nr:LysR family transcriptional regulator [Salifodinibacter halophilus]NNC26271.1 LysR family transcriptional regulator [Salifodinibacter halophilus]